MTTAPVTEDWMTVALRAQALAREAATPDAVAPAPTRCAATPLANMGLTELVEELRQTAQTEGLIEAEPDAPLWTLDAARDARADQEMRRSGKRLKRHLRAPGEPHDLLRRWWEERRDVGGWALLHGAYGTGKTWQGVMLWRWLYRQVLATTPHPGKKYTLTPELLRPVDLPSIRMLDERHLTAALAERTLDDEAREDLITCDLLIIDEAGARAPSVAREEALYDLLDARYDEELPVLVLSNLGPYELMARWGEAGTDRLGSRLIQCLGGPTLPWALELTEQRRW